MPATIPVVMTGSMISIAEEGAERKGDGHRQTHADRHADEHRQDHIPLGSEQEGARGSDEYTGQPVREQVTEDKIGAGFQFGLRAIRKRLPHALNETPPEV